MSWWCSARQHHSLLAEGRADLLHLLGAPGVCCHNEALGMTIQELDDLKKVVGLPGCPGFLGVTEVHQGLPPGFKDNATLTKMLGESKYKAVLESDVGNGQMG